MQFYEYIACIIGLVIIADLLLLYAMYKILLREGYNPKLFHILDEFIKMYKTTKNRQLTMILSLHYLNLSILFFLGVGYWCNWFGWFS